MTERPVRTTTVMASSWDKNFPAQIDSTSSSRVFMARMNYIAVAAMLYHRGVVPLDILKRRYIKNVMFRVFNQDTAWGKKLHDMLMGIREGINEKYVKEVQVVFSKSREQPDEVLEMFSSKFSYDNEQDALEITDAAGRPVVKLTYQGMEFFKKQVLELLLRIIAVAGALEKLPEGVVPSMQVLFYSRAPPGYVCPSFRRCKEIFAFRDYVEPFYIGRLDTDYGSMFLGVQSKLLYNAVELEQSVQTRMAEMSRKGHEKQPVSFDASVTGSEFGHDQSTLEPVQLLEVAQSVEKTDSPPSKQTTSPMRHSPEPATSAATESDEAPAHDLTTETQEAPPRSESGRKTRKRKGKEEKAGSSAPKRAARAEKGARKPVESQVTASAQDTTAVDSTNISATQPQPPPPTRRARHSLFNESSAGRRQLYLTPENSRLYEG
ncbi:HORMA domain-containing protein 1-like protein [Aphelenchoides avenae]|nr:HORMA domain-containing protein 1-like protein [Aphelenchus avenae]